MSMLGRFIKQPAEIESYTIDYSQDLTDGDNVISAEVISDVPGELIVKSFIVLDPRVRIWLEGGVDGNTYKITCTVDTADGRRLQDEFRVRVKDI